MDKSKNALNSIKKTMQKYDETKTDVKGFIINVPLVQ